MNSPKQEKGSLHSQLMKRDDGGRTVLHLAALSGNKEIFTTVVTACKEGHVKQQEEVHTSHGAFPSLLGSWGGMALGMFSLNEGLHAID